VTEQPSPRSENNNSDKKPAEINKCSIGEK